VKPHEVEGEKGGLREFRDLCGVHEEIERKLEQHQLAIVRGGYSRARALFESFRAALQAHMADEESILLPLYEERVKPMAGGAGAAFRAEHMKLERMMASIDARLERLADSRIPYDAMDHVRCIEQEFELKNLWRAHTLRERNVLFPALDAATEGDERDWMLSRCSGSETVTSSPSS
jgi:hemerythrin-like domain-containing protein